MGHESEVDSVSQSHRSACLSPRVDSGYGRLGSAPARPAVPEKVGAGEVKVAAGESALPLSEVLVSLEPAKKNEIFEG